MRHRVHGFTLVEMVVVIALIMLLIAMLLPTYGRVRLDAERSLCVSNLREIGTAIYAHVNERDGYLPGPSWYGQTARYKTGSKVLAEYLSIYMTHPAPTSSYQVNELFVCPSFARFAADQAELAIGRGYGAMSEPDMNDGKRVFGYPAFEGAPEYGPARMSAVSEPAKARAVRDIDYPLNLTAGWAEDTAEQPMHGTDGDQAIRNYLHFDGHVETVKEPLNY